MSKRRIVQTEDSLPPRAVLVVQRPVAIGVKHRFFKHFFLIDRLAGRKDRKLVGALYKKNHVLSMTPWMAKIRNEFADCALTERNETTALQSPLRQEAVTLIAQYDALRAQTGSLQDVIEQEQNVHIDNAAITSSEQLDTAEQRLRRRMKTRDSRVKAAQAQLAANKQAQEKILERLAFLLTTFNFHESSFQDRQDQIRQYYMMRQNTYVSSALHRVVADVTPVIPEIEWLNQSEDPFPQATNPVET